jgi:hypothetical protein
VYRTLLYSYWKKTWAFIKELQNKQALVFMDGNTKESTQAYTGISIDDRQEFLPVPVDQKYNSGDKVIDLIQSRQEINMVNMGRLVDWKTNLLIPAIRDIEHYARRNKIVVNLNVIGEGPSAIKLSRLMSLNSEFFKFSMAGRLDGKQLNELLDEQDIMIAMGTCALMGAMKGLPVIRLDISNKPVKSFIAPIKHKVTIAIMISCSSNNSLSCFPSSLPAILNLKNSEFKLISLESFIAEGPSPITLRLTTILFLLA